MSSRQFANPVWHLVDARHKIVGRLAIKIAHLIRGKHKPNWVPYWDCGDYVVVINASQVRFTGKKLDQKKYQWHTGYPGGLKERTARQLLEHKPEEVLRKAVKGNLPKNNLARMMLRKLRIFPGEKHLHTDKLPVGTPSVIV